MNCAVIRDLLPLYHDGVCSEESRAAVEAHLAACGACRTALAEPDAPLPLEPEGPALAQVRSVSAEWRRRKRLTWRHGALPALLSCALLALSAFLLTQADLVRVPNESILPPKAVRLSDGGIAFDLATSDPRRPIADWHQQKGDEGGALYLVPRHPVLWTEGHSGGSTGISVDPETDVLMDGVSKLYLGWGEDALLIWEEGMELPDAPADHWAERWIRGVAALERRITTSPG